ncbi:MAG: hypothetical protein Q9202_003984 [Teloschistes flavicans]
MKVTLQKIQRPMDLHAVYNDAMNGLLILTPINLEEPGKRILDSGTADGQYIPPPNNLFPEKVPEVYQKGTWLRSVRSSLSTQHHYFGSDIEAELFPSQPDGFNILPTLLPRTMAHPPSPTPSTSCTSAVKSCRRQPPNVPSNVIKKPYLSPKTRRPDPIDGNETLSAHPKTAPAMTDFAKMASEVWTGIGVGEFRQPVGAADASRGGNAECRGEKDCSQFGEEGETGTEGSKREWGFGAGEAGFGCGEGLEDELSWRAA